MKMMMKKKKNNEQNERNNTTKWMNRADFTYEFVWAKVRVGANVSVSSSTHGTNKYTNAMAQSMRGAQRVNRNGSIKYMMQAVENLCSVYK